MQQSSRNQSDHRDGRILNHKRSIDDDTTIFGGYGFNTELGDVYEDEYQDTIAKNMEDNSRRYFL